MAILQHDDLLVLLNKAKKGEATLADYRLLIEAINADQGGEVISQIHIFLANEKAVSLNHIVPYDHAYWQQALEEIKNTQQQIVPKVNPSVSLSTDGENYTDQPTHRIRTLISSQMRRWIKYAAAIIFIFGVGTYIWTASKKNTQQPVAVQQTIDIAPGKDGAILTLADGSQVVLDSLGNGVIALQNGSQVVIKNGELVYDVTGETKGEMAYNMMSTPKGRQYQVTLPDGTKVWLNAASSIRYPTVFTGKTRQVEIKGEVYFEVAKNIKMPFRVSVNESEMVEVLGTHFNVNAYENEATVNTTLLEGSVKVKGTKIKPGQQVLVNQQSQQEINIVDADIDKVMAWKNGLFNFEEATLEEIMRQVERWYDIEVVYQQYIPDIAITGKITRGVSLNDLLKNLGKMGMRHKLEGRKLIVLP